MMLNSAQIIARTELMGAPNYNPLPIVITRAEGVWVEDPEGHTYLDMLSAYSALNHGHRHPVIIQALKDQADEVTLTSRAFHNDKLYILYGKLTAMTKKSAILPMNTGAEAIETAIKAARRWAYEIKKVPEDQAEILVCTGNFHGRTITITSCSSETYYRQGFGPFTPGFRLVEYGDLEALEAAITPNTAALLIEPIQGEAGIIIPPDGYLKAAAELCKAKQVLFIADEIQTGFGRTGKCFACEWEDVVPDIYVLGKALGGGVYPVSAVAADHAILDLFEPGTHGSTFGGNPLACAAAIAALNVLEDEKLVSRSADLGAYMLQQLQLMSSIHIKEVRGRGLFVGIEMNGPARPYCERLMQRGILCKETHESTIRLAPPLTITLEELDWALEQIMEVLTEEEFEEDF